MHDAEKTTHKPIADSDAAARAELLDGIKRRDIEIETLKTLVVNQAHEIKILLRRLMGAKSEKLATNDLQLVLASIAAEEAALKAKLADLLAEQAQANEKKKQDAKNNPPQKPRGRRDLSLSSLPREEVIIDDPKLAAQGRLIDYDDAYKLMRIPGVTKVLHIKTAKYEVVREGEKTVAQAEPVKFLVNTMMHSSYVAFVAVQKFCMGVPHYRLEKQLAVSSPDAVVDRSVMCRNIEEHGNALGATIVRAMLSDAMTFPVLATDATGALILPAKSNDKQRRGCDRGHFFTVVAGTDHLLFHYTRHHTQKAVQEMLHGFRGYLQSDASSVYEIFNHGPPDPESSVVLVGCWAHCRRYFFEAALCKYAAAIEGLLLLDGLFAEERKVRHLPPADRKRQRDLAVKPLAELFFRWIDAQRAASSGRTLLTKALNYSNNQREELMRVFDDGRLELDNNRSERALRTPVVGRKNFMFHGSDVHAQAACAFYSLVASCRLHGIDPEAYLTDVIRIVPYWPNDRFLELSPKYWTATRAKLSPDELARPAGSFAVPPLLVRTEGMLGGTTPRAFDATLTKSFVS